jgi:2-hydroxy-3-keto-5-methylthiopentenyl-1-phosphate phosphatase
VLALEFATVKAPLAEVVEFVVREARVRPGFRELAARHRPLVVSGTFHELIEPVLAREGVGVELLANRLDPHPDGWRVLPRNLEMCAVCGEGCKRAALPPGRVAYAGDGYSDRCAALAADRVFARDGLARWLDAKGVGYEPFDDLFDVSRALEW